MSRIYWMFNFYYIFHFFDMQKSNPHSLLLHSQILLSYNPDEGILASWTYLHTLVWWFWGHRCQSCSLLPSLPLQVRSAVLYTPPTRTVNPSDSAARQQEAGSQLPHCTMSDSVTQRLFMMGKSPREITKEYKTLHDINEFQSIPLLKTGSIRLLIFVLPTTQLQLNLSNSWRQKEGLKSSSGLTVTLSSWNW